MEYKTRVLLAHHVDRVKTLDDWEFDQWWAWDEQDYRTGYGYVMEKGKVVVGHLMYVPGKSRLMLSRIHVWLPFRRQGIGSELIRRLKEKLGNSRRQEILALVPEGMLEMQLFLASNKFRARLPVFEQYFPTGESAYQMYWKNG